jgi:DNA-binding NtrC family response regulator
MRISLDTLNLAAAERRLCEEALRAGGNIVEAAALLGITRHALKRRIVKYRIDWPGAGAGNGDIETPRATAAMQL